MKTLPIWAFMIKVLKEFLEKPYWVILLIIGVLLAVLSCMDINYENKIWHVSSNSQPTSWWLFGIGIVLIIISITIFVYTLISKASAKSSGSDALSHAGQVTETNGVLSAKVGDCLIQIVNGRIEDFLNRADVTFVLPCNEYFDICPDHPKSTLGSFVNREFVSQKSEFQTLIHNECANKLGKGTKEQRTAKDTGVSYGPGRCVQVVKPLGRPYSVALLATSTLRAGLGLSSRISHLADGIRELAINLAETRTNTEEVIMPVLGGGNAGISPQLALIATLLAIAEAARYGQGGQRPKIVTIVVFKAGPNVPATVDSAVLRRFLDLVASLF